jgi:hypothetical protein
VSRLKVCKPGYKQLAIYPLPPKRILGIGPETHTRKVSGDEKQQRNFLSARFKFLV